MTGSRRNVALLLLASLLVGLAHIALLPPFEGFDETGHYSYIQQVAETGTWPRRGGKMSKDIDDYLKVAPTTDAMHGAWTYQPFFAAGPAVIAAGRQAIKTPPATPRAWAPGQIENWQAQHPPLYYAVLTPAYLVSKGWSFGAQLFVLRALSYLIAWGGLCVIVIAALRRRAPDGAAWLPLALAAWPFLFPMWFPEMGRLGNDSLITIFAACVFLLAWSATASAKLVHHALLGLAVGLGLLTKATFLPIAAAVLLVLAIRMLRARHEPGAFACRLAGLCVTAAVLLAVGGWWYALKLVETGAISGSTEAANLRDAGGMIAGLMKNLRVADLVTIPWGFVVSFFWGGTWSFIQPPRVAYLPFVLTTAIMAFGLARAMRREAPHAIDWFPLVALALFFAALTYYSLVTLATGNGTSPAWYLHAMAPIMALLVARGTADAMRGAWLCPLTALWFYPLVFLFAMTTTNVLYFAGCAAKLPERNYFSRATSSAMANSAIASPHVGIALFAIGWVIAVAAMGKALRSFRAGTPYSTASTR
jgi:4-amino-4-deoxy-L-arabinose transferase-like glycosyltransferase